MSKIFELNKDKDFVLVRYHYDHGHFHYDVFSENNNFIYLIQTAYCECILTKRTYYIAIIEAKTLVYLENIGMDFRDPYYRTSDVLQRTIEECDIRKWLEDFRREKYDNT
jgi:hypothetical protein